MLFVLLAFGVCSRLAYTPSIQKKLASVIKASFFFKLLNANQNTLGGVPQPIYTSTWLFST